MTRIAILCITLTLFLSLSAIPSGIADDSGKEGEAVETGGKAHLPSTLKEARGRARWMHETIHGALQVMHRDFFGDDDTLSLPSQSLEDVFKEMGRSWSIDIRWLGVNATKDDDHRPQDEFERTAAENLKAGKSEYEAMEKNRYRFVGAIKLQNECLKCHVPYRTSLEDRVAGLAISFDLNQEEKEK